MPTITIGAETIEVYQDLTQANAYFSTLLSGAEWTTFSSGDRSKALITSTNVFDRTGWIGAPTEPVDKTQPQPASTQPIEWPRTGAFDRNEIALPSDAIPLDIERGNMEYALEILNDQTILDSPNTGTNTRSLRTKDKVDVIEVERDEEFFQPTFRTGASQFPQTVQGYIGIYLAANRTGNNIFAGGTDVCSESAQDFTLVIPGFP